MENATDVLKWLLLSKEWDRSNSVCLSLWGISGCVSLLLQHAQINEKETMSLSTTRCTNPVLRPVVLKEDFGNVVHMTDILFEVQERDNLIFGLGSKVHFKGHWRTGFDQQGGCRCVFRTSPPGYKHWIMVQAMTSVEDKHTSTLVTEDLQHFRVLHLPYCGGDAYMHILIPKRGQDGDVFQLLKLVPDLTHYFDIKAAKQAAGYTLLLPKWRTESEQTLNETMELLNVPLCGLDWVTQHCVVEVQENDLLFRDKKLQLPCSRSRQNMDYIVDQPFIYVITTAGKKSRIMLFVGAVKDPRP